MSYRIINGDNFEPFLESMRFKGITVVLLDIIYLVGYNYCWNVLGTGILGAFFLALPI